MCVIKGNPENTKKSMLFFFNNVKYLGMNLRSIEEKSKTLELLKTDKFERQHSNYLWISKHDSNFKY